MTDYYDILGVNKNATQDEIKKAYKKLAIKTHPDRPGGSKEKFQDVGKAYKVLSDSSLRQKYDTYGEEGLQGGSMEGFNPFDLFSGMNSGGGFGNLFGNMFNMGGNQNSKHKINFFTIFPLIYKNIKFLFLPYALIMEISGFEPLTSAVQKQRSTN